MTRALASERGLLTTASPGHGQSQRGSRSRPRPRSAPSLWRGMGTWGQGGGARAGAWRQGGGARAGAWCQGGGAPRPSPSQVRKARERNPGRDDLHPRLPSRGHARGTGRMALPPAPTVNGKINNSGEYE